MNVWIELLLGAAMIASGVSAVWCFVTGLQILMGWYPTIDVRPYPVVDKRANSWKIITPNTRCHRSYRKPFFRLVR